MYLKGIQLTWVGYATSGTPAELQKLVPNVEVLEMKPGQTIV